MKFSIKELETMHCLIEKKLDRLTAKGEKKYRQKTIEKHLEERGLLDLAYRIKTAIYKKRKADPTHR